MDQVTMIVVAILGSGALNTLVAFLVNRLDKKNNDNSRMKTAVRLVMKDRITFLCEQYLQRGWVYDDELKDLIVMHKSYHDDLDGNGFLDNVMGRVTKLTIKVR